MNWGGSSKNGWRMRSILSSHILLQNKDMKNYFLKDIKKPHWFPRGVNTEEYFPMKKQKSLMDKYSILDNEIIILSVANISPIKGIDVLIKSFIKLSSKHNFIRLFIVGHSESNYGRKSSKLQKKLLFFQNSFHW